MFFFGEDNIFLKVGVVNDLNPARVVFTLGWSPSLCSFPGCGALPSHLRAGVQPLVGPGSPLPPPPQVAALITLSSSFLQSPQSA